MWEFLKKSKNGYDKDKNVINSDEYELCVKRIISTGTDVTVLKTKVEALETSLANMRGFINRKIGDISSKKETVEEPKDINNDNTVYFG
jgi:hypothetical protein